MAKDHGARQQKKATKQKAKRIAKKAELARRDSKDPTVRLKDAEKWPITHCLVADKLWEDGIGYLLIARRAPDGRFVWANYLVDVFCLGVKNAYWDNGTALDFSELVDRVEQVQTLSEVKPEAFAKIISGAIEYAASFGFMPHPDFRHAALLLEGIDRTRCTEEFSFGRDGKPFYFRGPNETLAQAKLICERVTQAEGDYIVQISGPGVIDGELDDDDESRDRELKST